MHDFCYFYLITMAEISKFCPKIMLYFHFKTQCFNICFDDMSQFAQNFFNLAFTDFQFSVSNIIYHLILFDIFFHII